MKRMKSDLEDMTDFDGPEYSHQRYSSRASSVPSCRFHFNEAVHSSMVDGPPPLARRDYEPGCPRMEETTDNDDSYRFYRLAPCDPSPCLAQYSSILYHDYLLPQAGPYHFLNPSEAFSYGKSSVNYAELHDAVASISSEGADKHGQQACSSHESAWELRQTNQLDMAQNVMCNVNSRGQMVVLNQSPSQSQMVHPVVLGHSLSDPYPLLYPAGDTLSPEQHPAAGGEGVPLNQAQQGFPSQPHLSSLTRPNTPRPSSLFCATASVRPGPYVPQFHQTPRSSHPETAETGDIRVQMRALERSKKPCNCTKSQCLKLYCDCFANGVICSNCNCINCCNNKEHETKRSTAIKTYLDRNPAAFGPKFSSRKSGNVKKLHTKGCNCKRSGCLKNYCECYEANIMCSSTCKCLGCLNYNGSPVMEQTAQDQPESTTHTSKSPLSCLTPDVVEATCGCLLAQAEVAEREGLPQPLAERMILEEFGQCLTQIVRSIFKSTDVCF